MKFECRISRSCIYWKPEERDWTELEIEAYSLEEALNKLDREAMLLEVRSGASKLVQELELRANGEWKDVASLMMVKER